MTFNTEKNKIFKLWNETSDNENIIITQKSNNSFIIDGIDQLNRLTFASPILVNFSSDFLTPDVIIKNEEIEQNIQEFRLTFNNINEKIIPYIHCETVYRIGTSGTIPNDSTGKPFDESLLSRLQRNEIFRITETSVEYISMMSMRRDPADPLPEVQYKFVCYIINPRYYSDR